MKATTSLAQRILSRVSIEDRGYTSLCWISDRSSAGKGYTKIGIKGKTWLTHRAAYVEFIGPIPEGLELDHLCRQRACCNPSHLEPVTGRINRLRGDTWMAKQVAQTHCLRGHELAGHNIYRRPDYPNKRECRTCRNTAHQRQNQSA